MKRKLFTAASAALVVVVLAGCASSAERRAKLPELKTPCVDVKGVASDVERGYLLRKAKAYLAEYGFAAGDAGAASCSATALATVLDAKNWELLERGLFRTTQSTAWRAEGLVSLAMADGNVEVEDETFNFTNYSTKVEVMDAIAWQLAKQFVYRWRPAK